MPMPTMNVRFAGALAVALLAVPVASPPSASAATTTFSSTVAVTIPTSGRATPSPTTIEVSGLQGVVLDVQVTLTGLSHAFPNDLGIVLVSPDGHALLLMDAVTDQPLAGSVDLTFSDSAAAFLPAEGVLTSGTYKPTTQWAGTDDFTGGPGTNYAKPGPLPGNTATFPDAFGGRAPNGTWQLFVQDFWGAHGGGSLAGWSLTITTMRPSAMPEVSGVTPTGPATSTTPLVTGTAVPGSTVTLYDDPDCVALHGVLGTGSAADFAGPGIPVTVPADAATTIFAAATEPGEFPSPCSTTSVTYTNDSMAPERPTLSAVTAAPSGDGTAVSVRGAAEPDSVVSVYGNGSCAGVPAASGTASAFGGTGLPVTVAAGSTTTFHATATDAAGNTSACSTSAAVYTAPLPRAPDTSITKMPAAKVKTTKKKAKVAFSFSSTPAGATFECSVDGKAFAACSSGTSFKAKVGKHTFAVRAVLGGVSDPTPATYSFKVKRKQR